MEQWKEIEEVEDVTFPIIKMPQIGGSTPDMDCIQAAYYDTEGGRIFPELVAADLVSVQPMSGPIGHAFSMRYKCNKDDIIFEEND